MRSLALIAVIAVAGCSSKPSIVGRWMNPDVTKPHIDVWEFNADGTYTGELELGPFGKSTVKISRRGTYSFDGSRLTLHWQGSSLDRDWTPRAQVMDAWREDDTLNLIDPASGRVIFKRIH